MAVMIETQGLESVQFDESDLDAALQEAQVTTDLSQEAQRAIAAYCMVMFSVAMAVREEVKYLNLLNLLPGVPVLDSEVAFFSEFGRILVNDIEQEYTMLGYDTGPFVRRVQGIFARVTNSARHDVVV